MYLNAIGMFCFIFTMTPGEVRACEPPVDKRLHGSNLPYTFLSLLNMLQLFHT
jgi:hypothetical protein